MPSREVSGYFRTDFLDSRSLSASPARIEDYSETAGRVRVAATGPNHHQPGDPDRIAAVLVVFS